MKVLIGVDGSAYAAEAARFVGQILAPGQDEVALYYSPPDVAIRQGSAEMVERARKALGEGVFQKASEQLPEVLRGKVHTILGTQRPAHGLIVAADEWRADLLVVGARGMGPLEGLLLGSVSKSVAHTASIPVLVVRRTKEQPPSELTVLLATDGSEMSQHAADVLGAFTWPPGSVGKVVSVIESMFVGHVPEWLENQARDRDTEAMARAWVEEHEAEKQAKEQQMRDYVQQLPAIFHGQAPIIEEGYPSEQILKAAGREAADLVAVGARGLKLWERLLLGSTSEKVLSNAPCSVLVVRRHERP